MSSEFSTTQPFRQDVHPDDRPLYRFTDGELAALERARFYDVDRGVHEPEIWGALVDRFDNLDSVRVLTWPEIMPFVSLLKPIEPADCWNELSDLQRRALEVLFKSGAFDADHRQKGDNIARAVAPAAAESTLKRPLAALVKRGLLYSREGTGGGYCLTAGGRVLVAQHHI